MLSLNAHASFTELHHLFGTPTLTLDTFVHSGLDRNNALYEEQVMVKVIIALKEEEGRPRISVARGMSYSQ